MPHTFTQVYIQAVFAVAVRQSLIKPDFKEELQKYITGIVRKKGQKMIEINSMPDHTHMLIGLKPSIALSDLIRDVKSDSTEFIKRKGWIRGWFNWQERFRRVFLLAFAIGFGNSLHSQPGEAPCEAELQE